MTKSQVSSQRVGALQRTQISHELDINCVLKLQFLRKKVDQQAF